MVNSHNNPEIDEEEDPLEEPLDRPTVRKLIREIREHGAVTWSGHALKEMEDDDLTAGDCDNVLRGGVCEFEEFIKGSWRYRITTPRICVVVSFRSRTELKIVTVWRIKQP